MAVSVDTVYQKVLAICNKEQRGYITPQEFNLLADRAQFEIFENYFNEIRNAERKPRNQQQFSDIVEQAEEKLQVFKSRQDVLSGSVTVVGDGCYKIISIERGDGATLSTSTIFYPVEIISQKEYAYISINPLTRPTTERPVAVRRRGSDNDLELFPGVVPSVLSKIWFYSRPSRPKWTYVVVNEQALYNQNAQDAQDFQIHSSEEENLVTKILQLAGVIIKQPDVQQAAMASYQMNNQEKNN